MAIVLKQSKRAACRRLLFCLLLTALFLPLWTEAGTCAEETEPLNTSGNLNTAPAVDPTEMSEGYSAVLYNNKNGLPSSAVNAIAQTSEGFLWIGTNTGDSANLLIWFALLTASLLGGVTLARRRQ